MAQNVLNRPRNFFLSANHPVNTTPKENSATDSSFIKQDNSTFPMGKDVSFATTPNEQDISTIKADKLDAFDLENSYSERMGQKRPQSLVNETALKNVRKFYQLRAWALIYPFIFVLFMMVNERRLSFRLFVMALITVICVFSLSKIRCLEPKRNYAFIVMISCCTMLGVLDFLLQFGFIGNHGWRQEESYISCIEGKKTGDSDGDKFHEVFCSGVKLAYYLNLIIYLPYFGSFFVYLFATIKLLNLTNYDHMNSMFRFRLEDEIEEEDKK